MSVDLKPGDKAPAFTMPTDGGGEISLKDLKGQQVVLYFYPKDDTPGCTMEGQEFTDLMEDFEAHNTSLVGVSKDTCVSHAAFRDKYGLTVQLLADVEGQLCEAYGVWQEKEKNGEKRMGIVRSTFIIDQQGVVRFAMRDVKPKGHAEAMLEVVHSL